MKPFGWQFKTCRWLGLCLTLLLITEVAGGWKKWFWQRIGAKIRARRKANTRLVCETIPLDQFPSSSSIDPNQRIQVANFEVSFSALPYEDVEKNRRRSVRVIGNNQIGCWDDDDNEEESGPSCLRISIHRQPLGPRIAYLRSATVKVFWKKLARILCDGVFRRPLARVFRHLLMARLIGRPGLPARKTFDICFQEGGRVEEIQLCSFTPTCEVVDFSDKADGDEVPSVNALDRQWQLSALPFNADGSGQAPSAVRAFDSDAGGGSANALAAPHLVCSETPAVCGQGQVAILASPNSGEGDNPGGGCLRVQHHGGGGNTGGVSAYIDSVSLVSVHDPHHRAEVRNGWGLLTASLDGEGTFGSVSKNVLLWERWWRGPKVTWRPVDLCFPGEGAVDDLAICTYSAESETVEESIPSGDASEDSPDSTCERLSFSRFHLKERLSFHQGLRRRFRFRVYDWEGSWRSAFFLEARDAYPVSSSSETKRMIRFAGKGTGAWPTGDGLCVRIERQMVGENDSSVFLVGMVFWGVDLSEEVEVRTYEENGRLKEDTKVAGKGRTHRTTSLFPDALEVHTVLDICFPRSALDHSGLEELSLCSPQPLCKTIKMSDLAHRAKWSEFDIFSMPFKVEGAHNTTQPEGTLPVVWHTAETGGGFCSCAGGANQGACAAGAVAYVPDTAGGPAAEGGSVHLIREAEDPPTSVYLSSMKLLAGHRGEMSVSMRIDDKDTEPIVTLNAGERREEVQVHFASESPVYLNEKLALYIKGEVAIEALTFCAHGWPPEGDGTCTDHNDVSGDGCADGVVEPGWVCTPALNGQTAVSCPVVFSLPDTCANAAVIGSLTSHGLNVVLEAQAHSDSVALVDTGNPPELLNDFRTGWGCRKDYEGVNIDRGCMIMAVPSSTLEHLEEDNSGSRRLLWTELAEKRKLLIGRLFFLWLLQWLRNLFSQRRQRGITLEFSRDVVLLSARVFNALGRKIIAYGADGRKVAEQRLWKANRDPEGKGVHLLDFSGNSDFRGIRKIKFEASSNFGILDIGVCPSGNINPLSSSVCHTVCGDEVRTSNEGCDDGNRHDGDGCSSSCEVETGWTCPEGGGECEPGCGDGKRLGSEECDDHNTESGDGCSSNCKREPGWECPLSDSDCAFTEKETTICETHPSHQNQCGSTTGECWNPLTCPPGQVIAVTEAWYGRNDRVTCPFYRGGHLTDITCHLDVTDYAVETCDGKNECVLPMANTIAGDPCRYTYKYGVVDYKCLDCDCQPVCGDDVRLGSEQCDDGNKEDGDGCSSTCQQETGWSCPVAGGACSSICGDGHRVGDEECDDGDTQSGDGCSSSCETETGWACPHVGGECHPTWDDCVLVGPEKCEDQNRNDGDGCSAENLIETGWRCPAVCTPCEEIHGDGEMVGQEQCDDGDSHPGDGCHDGEIEDGWTCTGEPSVCTDINECQGGGHNCDVPNAVCTNSMGSFSCACKNGWSDTTTDGSKATGTECQTVVGDGVVAGDEECDDGNTQSGDGCDSDGQVEDGYTCPVGGGACSATPDDGHVLGDEECDDGNTDPGDGCYGGQVEDGWTCTVPPGETASVCTDLNECDDNDPKHTCSTKATCTNLSPSGGRYECACNTGYSGDGHTCTDVNECQGGGHNCDVPNAVCTNSMGSFSCACKNGWSDTTTDGSKATGTECQTVVGDGVVAGDEECDDGNTQSGDGCDSDGNVEDGYTCPTGGGACSATALTTAMPAPRAKTQMEASPAPATTAGKETASLVQLCAETERERALRPATMATPTTETGAPAAAGLNLDGPALRMAARARVDGPALRMAASARVTTPDDGHVLGDEECDDGNTNPGDGCYGGQVEDGWTCTVPPGETASVCTDLNECDENDPKHTCSTKATCTNLSPSAGRYECACNEGWSGDGHVCTDINECQGGGHNCDVPNAVCTNSMGSFSCACKNGWSDTTTDGSKATGTECQTVVGDGDVAGDEECDDWNSQSGDGCDSDGNVEDGYTCPTGGGTCSGGITSTNAATVLTTATTVQSVTTPTEPSLAPATTAGKEMASLVQPCAETERQKALRPATMATPTTETGAPAAAGLNLDGPALRMAASARVTTPDDGHVLGDEECDDGNTDPGDGCYGGQVEDGWTCTVPPGETASVCTDLNECDENDPKHTCSTKATCTNLPPSGGRYECACNTGYSGDGHTCTDINECQGGSHNCDVPNSVCTNSMESFSCACKNGWSDTTSDGSKATGTECQTVVGDGDVAGDEECDDGNTQSGDGCDSDGQVEDGYTCPVGGGACTDIDECTSNAHTCDAQATCTNSDGSFSCACQLGWQGNGLSCAATCGDGWMAGSESCDDGDTQSGDGCSNTCALEEGWNCPVTAGDCSFTEKETIICETHPAHRNQCGAAVGDCWNPLTCPPGQVIAVTEAWYGRNDRVTCPFYRGGHLTDITCHLDVTEYARSSCNGKNQCILPMANTIGGDPCRYTYKYGVVDYRCSPCLPRGGECSQIIGDGEIVGDEKCDDGNAVSGDGCDSEGQPEDGWECLNAGSPCTAILDDCLLVGPEKCTDRSSQNGDGCSAAHKIESGWTCPTVCEPCTEIHGDGKIVGDENCDDGDTDAEDGCHNGQIEEGWTCTGEPSVCTDLNECDDNDPKHTCSTKATCTNLPPSGGRYECACNTGYSGDGHTCTDINECQGGSHNCDVPNSVCTSSMGSFSCACKNGWSDTTSDGSKATGTECQTVVGDGHVAGDEECDDGNAQSGDGCDSNGQEEPGYTCPVDGGACSATPDDGHVLGDEECDDGNTDPGDGCYGGQVEDGWTCTVPPGETASVCSDVNECQGSSHNCDVPNAVCTNSMGSFLCACKNGWSDTTSDGSKATGTECQTVVGDGVVAGDEECDDGNSQSGDGCDSDGQVEDGYTCPGIAGPCTDIDECSDATHNCDAHATCTNANGGFSCACNHGWQGDGLGCTADRDDCRLVGDEECTDTNKLNGDGCTGTHVIEDGWDCPVVCQPCDAICGDSAVRGSETCDDGNSNNGDGCSSSCRTEPGWTCPQNGGNCSQTHGDGKIVGDENCDDGDTDAGDGCHNGQIEEGWTCTGEPSVCTDLNECDDNDPKHTCSTKATCTNLPPSGGRYECACNTGYSGDGHTCTDVNECQEGSHNCDVPNAVCTNSMGSFSCACKNGWSDTTSDGSKATGTECQTVVGDGDVAGDEECDDGNTQSGDGCDSDGNVEDGWDCPVDGGACSDVNECTSNSHNCNPNAVCANFDGGFTCACSVGWQGDGLSCTATPDDGHVLGDEECDDGNTNPGDGCYGGQVEDGWTCTVPPGETASVCSDLNECDENDPKHTCSTKATCTNLSPSGGRYECACNEGWSGDGHVCTAVVGDGDVAGDEECDDSNTQSGDGCDSDGQVEDGWDCPVDGGACSDVNECTSDSHNCNAHALSVETKRDWAKRPATMATPTTETGAPAAAGLNLDGPALRMAAIARVTTPDDGHVLGDEECDDGNTNPGDGCYGGQVEDGWTCTVPPGETASVCTDVNECQGGGHNCDVPNAVCTNSMGSFSCACKNGWSDTTSGGSKATGTECQTVVGDGDVAGDEECDDGNTQSGDGCDSDGNVEDGWDCPVDGGACSAVCGDGDRLGTETCDDGDTEGGDGCSSSCQTETGWTCPQDGGECSPTWDDCLLVGTERCADRNSDDGDGCSALNTIEDGWECPTICDPCQEIIGDGEIVGDEECDDGNSQSGDGCDSEGNIEDGWECNVVGASCTAICGDGKRLGLETCDDGDTESGDGCSSSCQTEPGWSCAQEGAPCEPVCGDRARHGTETCDDGDAESGDGCSSTCQTETGYSCPQKVNGDGNIVGDENCDDGDTDAGDGCNNGQIEEGWTCTGEPSVCTDLNECDENDPKHTCSAQATCTNLSPSGGRYECACNEGWSGDGHVCTDVNECQGGGHNCDVRNAVCTNSMGSFSCACKNGWSDTTSDGSKATGTECQTVVGDDVVAGDEECDDGNTQSGDGCDSDGKEEDGWVCPVTAGACTDVDECADNSHNCNAQATCTNSDGGFSCACNQGWQGDGISCSVVHGDGDLQGDEECDDGDTDAGDGCSGGRVEDGWTCTGEPSVCTGSWGGGFIAIESVVGLWLGVFSSPFCLESPSSPPRVCGCKRILMSTSCLPSCLPADLNECDENDPKHTCSAQATCTNLPPLGGRYDCNCNRGYSGDGYTCTDINECQGGGHNCDVPNAVCTNSMGSFSCACKNGWSDTTTDGSKATGTECQTVVGDGDVAGDEECDDSNTQSGDGCDSDGQVEDGYTCPVGGGACSAICGNGERHGTETCDDGDSESGDGCSSTCQTETGWTCPQDGGECSQIHGDGKIAGDEECDDGNSQSGDGCDSEGNIEDGWECNQANTPCTAVCGDGKKLGLETCDDGDTESGDGCSSSCQTETGWTCPQEGLPCQPLMNDCLLVGSERCTDGNSANGDGCSSTHQIESGWECPTVCEDCQEIIGDGAVVGDEECDDGDSESGDGCDSNGKVEDGWECTFSPSAGVSVCTATWDDCLLVGTERCADRNSDDGDGCSALNTIEDGWECPTICSPCTEIHGDGEIVGDEECDDGNSQSGDGCDSEGNIEDGWECNQANTPCSEICGDGVQLGAEGCDDGDLESGDGCSSSCQKETGWTCPQGGGQCEPVWDDCLLVGEEKCEDENRQDGDGCSSTNQIEDGWECPTVCEPCEEIIGDGKVVGDEECDDSNTENGDGCSSDGKVEDGYTCPSGPGDCNDINECTEGTHGCVGLATCTNTDAAFLCECPEGFHSPTDPGTECEDLNECDENDPKHTCSTKATCTNLSPSGGRYECACNEGWSGDGHTCTDVNECNGAHDCDSDHALCTNSAGSFSCACKNGWSNTTSDGSKATGTECQTVVGDGIMAGDEKCDDGNAQSGDGCDSNGNVEDGYTCLAEGEPCEQETDVLNEGDGCIDNNSAGGDGCSPDGRVEEGFICSASTEHCGPNVWDCVLVGGEECADGNSRSGDGCSSTSLIEDGWECPTLCSDCIPTFGDGTRVGWEECDDGDTDANDGCFEGRVEEGWECQNFDNAPSVCQDKNECLLGVHNCNSQASCENKGALEGRFTCACNLGFEGDGVSCSEIDECARGTDDCSDFASCTNTQGSFSCDCRLGWHWEDPAAPPGTTCSTLVGDGIIAPGVELCDDGNGDSFDGCSAIGIPEPGFACLVEGALCENINECSSAQSPLCNTLATCLDTIGSYTCTCNLGYEGDGQVCEVNIGDGLLTGPEECDDGNEESGDGCDLIGRLEDGFRCPDPGVPCSNIDECAEGVHDCPSNAECVDWDDSQGSFFKFFCKCKQGYFGDGRTCTTGEPPIVQYDWCSPHATVIGYLSEQTCRCRDGFRGDGAQCENVDECTEGLHNCDAEATCTEAFGSFTCQCPEGKFGPGVRCFDDVELLVPPSSNGAPFSIQNGDWRNVPPGVPSLVAIVNVDWVAPAEFLPLSFALWVKEVADSQGNPVLGVDAPPVVYLGRVLQGQSLRILPILPLQGHDGWYVFSLQAIDRWGRRSHPVDSAPVGLTIPQAPDASLDCSVSTDPACSVSVEAYGTRVGEVSLRTRLQLSDVHVLAERRKGWFGGEDSVSVGVGQGEGGTRRRRLQTSTSGSRSTADESMNEVNLLRAWTLETARTAGILDMPEAQNSTQQSARQSAKNVALSAIDIVNQEVAGNIFGLASAVTDLPTGVLDRTVNTLDMLLEGANSMLSLGRRLDIIDLDLTFRTLVAGERAFQRGKHLLNARANAEDESLPNEVRSALQTAMSGAMKLLAEAVDAVTTRHTMGESDDESSSLAEGRGAGPVLRIRDDLEIPGAPRAQVIEELFNVAMKRLTVLSSTAPTSGGGVGGSVRIRLLQGGGGEAGSIEGMVGATAGVREQQIGSTDGNPVMRISTVAFPPSSMTNDTQIAVDTSSGVSVLWHGETLHTFWSASESMALDEDTSMPAARCGGRINAPTITLEVSENPLNPWTEETFGSADGEGGIVGPVVSVNFRRCGDSVSLNNVHGPPIEVSMPVQDQVIATAFRQGAPPEWELRGDGGVTLRWRVSAVRRVEQPVFCRFLDETASAWASEGCTVRGVTWPSGWASSSSSSERPTVTCACSHLTDFSLSASTAVEISDGSETVPPSPEDEGGDAATPSAEDPLQQRPVQELPPESPTEEEQTSGEGGDACAASVVNCPWFIPVVVAVPLCILLAVLFLVWCCCCRNKTVVAAGAAAAEEKSPLTSSQIVFLDSRTHLGSRLPLDTRCFLEGGGEWMHARDSNAYLSLDASTGQAQLWADGGERLVWCTPTVAATEEEMRMEAEPATPVAAGLPSPVRRGGSDSEMTAVSEELDIPQIKVALKDAGGETNSASGGAVSGAGAGVRDDADDPEVTDERQPMTTRNHGGGKTGRSLRFALFGGGADGERERDGGGASGSRRNKRGGGGSNSSRGSSRGQRSGGETVRSRLRDMAAAVGDFTVRSLAAMTGRSSRRRQQGKFELCLTPEGRLAVMFIPSANSSKGGGGSEASNRLAQAVGGEAAGAAAGGGGSGGWVGTSSSSSSSGQRSNRRASYDDEMGGIAGSPQTRRAAAISTGASYVWQGPDPSEFRGAPVQGPFYAYIQQSPQQSPTKSGRKQPKRAASRQGSRRLNGGSPQTDSSNNSMGEEEPEIVVAVRATDEIVWTSSRGVIMPSRAEHTGSRAGGLSAQNSYSNSNLNASGWVAAGSGSSVQVRLPVPAAPRSEGGSSDRGGNRSPAPSALSSAVSINRMIGAPFETEIEGEGGSEREIGGGEFEMEPQAEGEHQAAKRPPGTSRRGLGGSTDRRGG
uniref:EGF-like domain-containing protein n=1 Tax=Chromera velia CCMP2878 TaxID=1169474 RepID=A0A0G4F531_9ALVE|eukprot:Cvel_167.t1-p1 / transcript=Cvel_167.t1 / gene=Cvel_167 / organism=Chromera_velia_CCMP2878 / gene_product=Fibrillin-1, putative / transcript_product=Fibrillin-1, putative / location=Cvel_scaffold10:165207-217608(-) / protein_length=6816 / sequence_SO=supercontig / SO=protein_coding / is_pseudo=false